MKKEEFTKLEERAKEINALGSLSARLGNVPREEKESLEIVPFDTAKCVKRDMGENKWLDIPVVDGTIITSSQLTRNGNGIKFPVECNTPDKRVAMISLVGAKLTISKIKYRNMGGTVPQPVYVFEPYELKF